MTVLGISKAAVYVPHYRLAPDTAAALDVGAGISLAGPDEDAATMLWEVLDRLTELSEPADLLVRLPLSESEPRRAMALVSATGVASPRSCLHLAATAASTDVLAAMATAPGGALAVVVDRNGQSDPLGRPTSELACALVVGEPLVAKVESVVSSYELTFDRWDFADGGTEQDRRFIEETLVARTGSTLLAAALEQAAMTGDDIHGVVVTCGTSLRAARLCSQWKVEHAWPVLSQISGDGATAALVQALKQLAEAGPGSSVAIVDLGWGGGASVLMAGPNIRDVDLQFDSGSPQGYGLRAWIAARGNQATPGPWTSPSELVREGPDLLGPVGGRCQRCGSTMFPRAGVCEACGSSEVQPQPLARLGTVMTHSVDELYAAPAPIQMVLVELDGGGRFYGQATRDTEPWFAVGDRARLVLRRLHTGMGLPHYYWKVDHA